MRVMSILMFIEKIKMNENLLYTKNRQALHEYDILYSLEVGMKLFGDEVKSIKNYSSSLNSSYASIIDGEVWLFDFNINNSVRNIKLLLSKKEIKSLEKDLIEKGNALIPLKIYRNKSYLKLELGLGKGRKKFDKRQNIKNKDLIRSESLKIKI